MHAAPAVSARPAHKAEAVLTLNKKSYYAIEAVLYIAYNAKLEPVAGNQVAEAQNLPTRYLEPMMQKLVRAGILRGVRGPQGGYMLGRERRQITLADICTVIAKENNTPATATALGSKVLHSATQHVLAAFYETLNAITLAQLCEQAEKENIAPRLTPTNNFVI